VLRGERLSPPDAVAARSPMGGDAQASFGSLIGG
jgi:hypothetical protein